MTVRPPEPAPVAVQRLLDVAGIASRLGVSEKTIRRMINRGELSAHRVGRLLRIAEADLADYLSSRRTIP